MTGGGEVVCPSLSVVIPSYRRGKIVLDALNALMGLAKPADELLLVDQTLDHPADVIAALQTMHDCGQIRWIRLPEPSIPHAMNVGLQGAKSDVVLLLDDDIVPDPLLVAAHRAAQSEGDALVAGRVFQPGQGSETLRKGETFRFTSDAPARIDEFMGGNFSVRRDVALALGGFDENFVGAAYRFEAEFASRYVRQHGKIRYEPGAIIHHLAISTGGTRAHGHHLRTAQPAHTVGAYYFLLRARPRGWWWQMLWRPLRAVRTRFHLRHPWRIPPTLLAEVRGFFWALRLLLAGPKLVGVGAGLGNERQEAGATSMDSRLRGSDG
ncbi:MAG: glycosyltransferase family 2 protein [Thermomonas sp.]|uniref:glycosyltransferase family 2 protein n=1 Tax=Thermomonas sp. TaxID=1971895 RepID=UPI00262E1FDE|nr:glycosyltransferase [Thermomonas sp.]MCC7096253.1 glycosyltransferase family 2 protein [Thermomonas sp.]